tara:strand:- start:7175 stop:7432 length:258 start_codon:yes stop_codon:yes gene_type:complete
MRVVVYGAEWCEPCRKVKEELEAADVPYIFRDIESNLVAKQHALSVQKTIPLVEIEARGNNSVVIGGYEETKDKLDIIKFIFDNR